MHYFSEFVICLVTLAVAEGVRHEIRTVIGEDVQLPCAAKSKAGVQYRSVTWYKIIEGPPRTITGLVRLTENNGKVEKYNGVEREVDLVERTQSLLLSNVTEQDSGIYNCFLSAPLGHQNQEGEIVLKVYGSVSQTFSSIPHFEEHLTVEKMEFNKSDTIYVVVAITVLGVALLMLCLSYVCLRNVFQSNKKLSKDSLLKMPHQGRNLIVTKHLDCKTLPEVFV